MRFNEAIAGKEGRGGKEGMWENVVFIVEVRVVLLADLTRKKLGRRIGRDSAIKAIDAAAESY